MVTEREATTQTAPKSRVNTSTYASSAGDCGHIPPSLYESTGFFPSSPGGGIVANRSKPGTHLNLREGIYIQTGTHYVIDRSPKDGTLTVRPADAPGPTAKFLTMRLALEYVKGLNPNDKPDILPSLRQPQAA